MNKNEDAKAGSRVGFLGILLALTAAAAVGGCFGGGPIGPGYSGGSSPGMSGPV